MPDETLTGIKTEIEQPEVCYGKIPEKLPLEDINYFPEAQTRVVYEGEDDLGYSIKENDLLHSPLVAEFEPEEARENLAVLNQLWGSDYQFEDLRPNQAGNYYFLVAGHRRIIAIHGIEHEGEPAVYVMCNMRRGITIDDALALQITENAGHRGLPPEREAQVIVIWHKRNPQYTTMACAKKLGVSEDKVRNAWRFHELPDSVKELAGRALPYTRVLQLHRLAKAYRLTPTLSGEPRYSTPEIERLLYLAAAFCRDNRWGKAKLNEYIDNVISDSGLVDTPFDDERQGALFRMATKDYSEQAELERLLRGLSVLTSQDIHLVATGLRKELATKNAVLDELTLRALMRMRQHIDELISSAAPTVQAAQRLVEQDTLLTA